MTIKLRPNLWLAQVGDNIDLGSITTIITTSEKRSNNTVEGVKDKRVIKFPLKNAPGNPNWLKDLACHTVKYAMDNGERVLIVLDDDTSFFVACRAVCELEEKNIFEIFNEIKQIMPGVDYSPIYYQ